MRELKARAKTIGEVLRATKRFDSELPARGDKLRFKWIAKGSSRTVKRDRIWSKGSPYRLYYTICFPPRTNKTQQKFKQKVRLYDAWGPGPRTLLNRKIWVTCECEYFKFNCEAALAHHRTSHIRYSNGELPSTTNPSLAPVVCKHLWRLLHDVIRVEIERKSMAEDADNHQCAGSAKKPSVRKNATILSAQPEGHLSGRPRGPAIITAADHLARVYLQAGRALSNVTTGPDANSVDV